jgi:hypothetical protein
LGRRRIFIFRVCGAGAAGVRRLDLWGLCRQQRIATTWTWASGVLALSNFRPTERSDRERVESSGF